MQSAYRHTHTVHRRTPRRESTAQRRVATAHRPTRHTRHTCRHGQSGAELLADAAREHAPALHEPRTSSASRCTAGSEHDRGRGLLPAQGAAFGLVRAALKQSPMSVHSARVVHIVEIPHPATQGHAHPSPRRLAVNGRPQRAVPPWRSHLARLRCRRAAWTAACAGLRACESRRSAAPLLVAHHAARPRKESLGAAGGVRVRPPPKIRLTSDIFKPNQRI